MRSSRVLGYGLGVWLGMVGISLILLPAEGKHEALYESVKLTTMVALVLGFAIRYLRRRPEAAGPEGVLVGLVWAAVTTAGDLGLYLGGAFNIGLDVYFTDVASSYSVMPVITGLAIGLLAPKPSTFPAAAEPAAATAESAAHAAVGAPAAVPAATNDVAPSQATVAEPAQAVATAEITPVQAVATAEVAPVQAVAAEVAAQVAPQHPGRAGAGAQLDVDTVELHTIPDAPAVPVPAPSHAEASLVAAGPAALPAEETDRPIYIPRGNC
ncbi:hypothetical protein [Catellatospora vulcania]|uniref:hypothetical protein n=1 Tax=Catellatospora vulcania TaxID=1460450 RepID=UPI0012D414BE|nr:hypothetical protein [Catellatospora vulcania]